MPANRRLLLVDDDPLNTQTLVDIFTHHHYELDTANSGAEALEKAREMRYGLVLSDIKMEGMNGVELLLALKKIQPATPVILMTAYTDDELILQGIREGALIALAKPLDIEGLLVHIANILRR